MNSYATLGNRLQPVKALAQMPDLRGRVALVTGGTDGLGRQIVGHLASAGATTLLTARNASKGERVLAECQLDKTDADIHVIPLDLASLQSVARAADDVLERWSRLDLLVCNAAHTPGKSREETAEGFELTFGVNHLGHAALVKRLEPLLRAAEPSRVVVVASEAHTRTGGGLPFDDLQAESSYRRSRTYARSKLANILYARELSRRLEGTGVAVYVVHPGGLDTPMMQSHFRSPLGKLMYSPLRRWLFISASDAAAGVLRVGLDPSLPQPSGAYFELGTEKRPHPTALDDAAAGRLWDTTESLLLDRA